MTNTVQTLKVIAVQEPGYANVWSIQDGTGSTVARLTINDDAEVLAKRLVNAFNASSIADASLLDRAAATIDSAHVPGTDSRSCQWCGKHSQTLKRWTEQVQCKEWVNPT